MNQVNFIINFFTIEISKLDHYYFKLFKISISIIFLNKLFL